MITKQLYIGEILNEKFGVNKSIVLLLEFTIISVRKRTREFDSRDTK